MANDIKLQESHPVDENLRPLKVGGKSTAIETAQHGNGAKVNGNFEVTSDIKGKDATLGSLTTEDISSKADLTVDTVGDINLTSADVNMDATKKLYLDGGGDTYISEVTADSIGIKVGDDFLFTLTESGSDGNVANFKTACAGFTRQEATFSTTGVIDSGGTDDTDIDFRHSNKYRLEMTGDITTINLIFPIVSGNFLLVCTTNGDHDVTNWKAWEYDETAATTADVLWAGGSVPAFTDSGVDIVSFYWDSSDQQAYGVAFLAFATP